MQEEKILHDQRLIEAGFPCHQVGAETQRERDTGKAPPTHRLHIWWARRPLTPSRAAILGSLLPASTDPDLFLRQLGIEKTLALVGDSEWVLPDVISKEIECSDGEELLPVNDKVIKALEKEHARRMKNRQQIQSITAEDPVLGKHPVVLQWQHESQPLLEPWPELGDKIEVIRVAADPTHINDRIEFRKSDSIKKVIGDGFSWDIEDLYGYDRAYSHQSQPSNKPLTILDPTSGGGSIPFEALRLGHNVIANDLNPVAAVILNATLKYPCQYGVGLALDIKNWGEKLLIKANDDLEEVFSRVGALPENEYKLLTKHLTHCESLISDFNQCDAVDYLYARQVTCPHCGGVAPLLNTCWLAKEGEKWGCRIVIDNQAHGGKVSFEPYRMQGNKGPNGEDPNFATVKGGVGLCVHCKQALAADAIKAQACGESALGTWKDRLYAVVAVRFQPKLDKNGQLQRFKTGERKGEIKTEKIRFFRAPNERDLEALEAAEKKLLEKWPAWEAQGLIPTEAIPVGHKTMEPLRVGMNRWCDMFTPRQLLGHLTLIEELNRLKPLILKELGTERGRAVVTYLQFMIDKGLDYNSRQTRWEYTRSIVKGTFGRHDFSLKWTFGEMVFTGPNSGAAWGLSQVLDAYAGIAELLQPLHEKLGGEAPPVTISCGTAAHLEVEERSVDLICIDPPYYNNVQYAELSDYFYVWQRRTLDDLYPDLFRRRLTNKNDEAVANPSRDGNAKQAAAEYERLMGEIFAECHRVLSDDGIMTVMFTHKTQEAWEALTKSLIENGWIISASFPVESEASESIHQKNMAAAASSIFISCRKKAVQEQSQTDIWVGIGGWGVAAQVRQAVRDGLTEFAPLGLNPVDEMVASYGRALQVLSQHWPVLDGDELVSPLRAMREASAVVAQYQVNRISNGRLQVADLNPEAAMALTLYGIFGLGEFPFDEALSLSKSLTINLEHKSAGYGVDGAMIGINDELASRRVRSKEGHSTGYHAPLIRRGSKLRLAGPEERNPERLSHPQTEWDVLHGLIMAFREGDVPVARAYLAQHAEGRTQIILDLLAVWSTGMSEENLRKEANAMLFGLKL